MAKRNDGKELEGKLHDALLKHQEQSKTNFVRLHDATSSGGRGFAQPGDFIWLVPNMGVLIECKSSDVGADLLQLIKSSKKSRDQVPRHRLWHIAQHPSVYVHANLMIREVKAYCGKSVCDALTNKTNNRQLRLLGVRGMSDLGGLLDDILSALLQHRETV
jgi:hypothetical protein